MRVLIAMDGSSLADKAFDWYLKRVHKAGNEVIVYNCAKVPALPTVVIGGLAVAAAAQIDNIIANHHAESKLMRDKLTAKCNEVGLDARVVVETKEGGAGQNIIRTAKDCLVELIVTGTRGQGKISRTVFGSVSDHVLHHADVPVLICH